MHTHSHARARAHTRRAASAVADHSRRARPGLVRCDVDPQDHRRTPDPRSRRWNVNRLSPPPALVVSRLRSPFERRPSTFPFSSQTLQRLRTSARWCMNNGIGTTARRSARRRTPSTSAGASPAARSLPPPAVRWDGWPCARSPQRGACPGRSARLACALLAARMDACRRAASSFRPACSGECTGASRRARASREPSLPLAWSPSGPGRGEGARPVCSVWWVLARCTVACGVLHWLFLRVAPPHAACCIGCCCALRRRSDAAAHCGRYVYAPRHASEHQDWNGLWKVPMPRGPTAGRVGTQSTPIRPCSTE
jgi:hypothetical protein